MDARTIKLNDKLCAVISLQEYAAHSNLYDPQHIGIQIDNYVYPIVQKNALGVGVHVKPNYLVALFNEPSTDREKEEYSVSKVKDCTKAENMRELMENQECIRSLEREILTNVNNVFEPKIFDQDSAEMRGFKEAVIRKGIDKGAYSPRLGANAANDLRLFNEHEITLKKTKKIAKAFDMKVTMIFEDARPDVPNPIGAPIIVEVTGGE